MGSLTVIDKVIDVWPIISPIFSVPHTKDEYNRLVNILDELIDEVGNNENHPKAGLMESIGALIDAYESINVPELNGNPIDSLKYLMEEHGLNPSNLSELGSLEFVSKILDGRVELSLNQIKMLSKRFNVSPLVFIN